MNYLKLNVESHVHTTRAGDIDDRWDRDDTHTDYDVQGLVLEDKDSYTAVPNYLDAKEGDWVAVLYAVYSTGDSFGHDANGGFEFINVFKNLDDAEAAAKSLKEDHTQKPYNERHEGKYNLSNGTEVRMGFLPWSGYFERLTYMEATMVQIGGGKRRIT